MKTNCNNINALPFGAKLTLRGDIDVLSVMQKKELKEIASSFAHGEKDAVDVFVGLRTRMYANEANRVSEKRDVIIATYLDEELMAHKVYYPNWKNKAFCQNPFQFIKKNLLDIKATFLKNNQ